MAQIVAIVRLDPFAYLRLSNHACYMLLNNYENQYDNLSWRRNCSVGETRPSKCRENGRLEALISLHTLR